MRRLSFFVIVAAIAGPAATQVPAPDPVMVATITEAAKICGFDDVGLKWKEKSPDVIQIWLMPEEIQSLSDPQTASPKFARLKDCFFAWAYDRKVKVEMNVGEKTP